MAKITEDYVSFETAKLLKEKGYKGSFNGYYNDAGCIVNRPSAVLRGPEYHYYERISLYTAIKWLREVHKLHIIIHYGDVGYPEEPQMQYWFEVVNAKGQYCDCNIVDGNTSYEDASEAAIKYCLENLI